MYQFVTEGTIRSLVEKSIIRNEVNCKPIIPTGAIGRDAFGNIPEFIDIGIRKRAIVSMGKQDVNIEGIWKNYLWSRIVFNEVR